MQELSRTEAAGRARTDVLVDLLDVAAKDDDTDPLVLICQTLVRNVPAFKFVTFVHVGEVKTLREIASELVVYGRRISANSIRAYQKELESVYLLEVSEVYDTFERCVVKSAGVRLFFTDLELRAWRYGPAPEYEASRVALNTLYLRLRRTYDKVYTPRDKDADFLTLEPDGTPRLWSVAFGSAQEQAFFHPFGQSNWKKWGGGGILGS